MKPTDFWAAATITLSGQPSTVVTRELVVKRSNWLDANVAS